MSYEIVIGLEVHVQLATKTKIFSGSSTAYGAEPNTQANEVDLALPGVLPVLNKEALHLAVKFGLAIGAHINQRSTFDRKNYFYPDLPKGYQISQFACPVVGEGKLEVTLEDGTKKIIGVTRAHLEEDAGKSIHDQFPEYTGVDLNRAGTPLLEIVSEPDMRSAQEAIAYLKTLHTLVRHLEISDGNMQEGSFRCDVNISLRPFGQKEFGTRAEIKNVNSFKFAQKAIEYEVERQAHLLDSGKEVVQETRLFDASTNTTRSMRSKEDAQDYRYFPDPDLLPCVVTDDELAKIKSTLPELPEAKKARYIAECGLNEEQAGILTSNKAQADYFEAVIQAGADAKTTANWIIGELSNQLNQRNLSIESSPVSAADLAQLLARISDNTISGKIAKDILPAMLDGEGTADEIIDKRGLKQISDSGELEAILDKIIADNPGQVEQLKAGKDKLKGFFVGQAMKASGGKANPKQINEILSQKLSV